jgi:arylsulfatase A-like enzyme
MANSSGATRAAGGAWLALLAACAEDAAPRAPNALLISIDTLRPDFLGCYGYPRETSPTLDALAARGVRFDDVTAAAPWTLPSHATMLTGLYPNHHGVKTHATRLAEGVITLAEELRDRGFETFAVVNTHNVGAPQFRLGQGFDERFRYVVETHEDPATGAIRTGNDGAEILSAAREFLAGRDPERPFFLFLHFYDVHTDFTAAPEYRERFVGPYDGALDGTTAQLADLRLARATLDEDDLTFLREMYAAEIRELDDRLGSFFAWLEAERLLAETLVMVTSDHGEEFQEHGSFLHGRTHYQEVARIPLIVAGPGVPAGVVVASPAHGVDVTPTLLAALGVPSRQPRDGIDLAPAWRGEVLPARTFFAEADHNNVVGGREVSDVKKMARQGAAKYLLDTHTGATELYDLNQDPRELRDLSFERPGRAAALRAELERFLAGEVAGEPVAPPSEDELRALEALGY